MTATQYIELLESAGDRPGVRAELVGLCQECAALEGRQAKLATTVGGLLLMIRERDSHRLCTSRLRQTLGARRSELEKVERDLLDVRARIQSLSVEYLHELDEEDSDG